MTQDGLNSTRDVGKGQHASVPLFTVLSHRDRGPHAHTHTSISFILVKTSRRAEVMLKAMQIMRTNSNVSSIIYL